MMARELLNEVDKQNMIIKHKLEELERLKVLCEMSGISFEGEKVQGSSDPKKTTNALIEYITLKDEVHEYINNSIELKNKVMKIVDKIQNKKCIDIIYKRYFENKGMYRIANELNYSHQRVYQLHDQAMREINSLLEEIC